MSRSAQAEADRQQKEKLIWMAVSLVAAAVILFFVIRSCEERPVDPIAANPNGKQIPVQSRREKEIEKAALEAYEADRKQ